MTKIRRSKRRGGNVEMHRFDQFFAWGIRFDRIAGEPPFDDGLSADAKAHPATQEAVGEAWHTLGPAFMRDWPEPDRMPWAARMFGLPRGCEHLRFVHAY